MNLTKMGAFITNLFCVLTLSLNIHAMPGDLDTTFDGDGKTTTSIGFNDYAQDLVIQPDGKIVAVGYSAVDFSVTDLDISLARFNADGSLDTSFGTGGKVLVAEAGNQRADAVVLLPNGKILAVGNDTNRLMVYRFNSDGSVDNTFGTNGKVIHTIVGANSYGNDAVLQPDGKIVIAGMIRFNSEMNNRFTVFRLNADGSLDTSFNSIGYNARIDGAEAFTVALQADGKIIVGGANGSIERGEWGRFGADGILEGSSLTFSDAELHDVVIQPDGKYVFAGVSQPPAGGLSRTTIARFNADKTRDVHFGNGGFNWISWSSLGGSIAEGHSLVIQPSGRIIVGGPVFFSQNDRFGIARFGGHGFLDIGFGDGGRVVTVQGTGGSGSGGGEFGAMTQQADGKIVAVGSGFNGANFDYAVARYDASDSTTAQTRSQFDWDGDGRADVSVYRPSTSAWYIFNSRDSSVTVRTFGIANDVPVPADFDGDAKTDFAIYRPSNGQWWYFLNGFNQVYNNPIVGVPRPGDFTGDGRADIIAYEPITWNRRDSTNTIPQNVVFGAAGDKPVLGDFDGDAKVDPAIYRPSTGEWWYAASSAGGAHRAARWGISTDIPAPADFDGDFKTDFAVYRPSEGAWYIYNSSNNSSTILNFGLAEDKPVAADYDGDGKADIAVFRPSTGVWYLLQSTAGFSAMQFGVSTDIPNPNAFVP